MPFDLVDRSSKAAIILTNTLVFGVLPGVGRVIVRWFLSFFFDIFSFRDLSSVFGPIVGFLLIGVILGIQVADRR